MRSKNIWIGLTVAVIWLVVLMTSLGAPELTFGDEPVVFRPAAIVNWFWGLLATVFVLRTTIFRRPDEMGWGQTQAYPWILAVVGAAWIVALLASSNAPDVVINDNITVPIGSIVAPPIVVAVTLYACDFLVSGFASRQPLGTVTHDAETLDSTEHQMPLPKWLARLNKRTFNKMELKRGVRPVLTHVGRSSGNTYQTPLDAHPIDDGYTFIINYGKDSDWVQNIMAAGTATLTVGDEVIQLDSPRVVPKQEAQPGLPATVKSLPGFVNEVLQMDVRR